jgi:Uma2 family endonuclease
MELAKQFVKPSHTEKQYLAVERAAKERHEYLDGEIYLMAGEREEHGIISVNVVITLGTQLKGSRCQVRTKDTKVRGGPTLKAPDTTRILVCSIQPPAILVVAS